MGGRGCLLRMQITWRFAFHPEEFLHSIYSWATWSFLSGRPKMHLCDHREGGMRRSGGTNTSSSNCCWKTTWHVLPWCRIQEKSTKMSDCSHMHGWGKWIQGSVSNITTQLAHTATDRQDNCKCARSRVKGLKIQKVSTQGGFGRVQAMNKSKPSNNVSRVLMSELIFKNVQSQSANFTMINSCILMKEGLLKYKCHSRWGEGSLLTVTRKPCSSALDSATSSIPHSLNRKCHFHKHNLSTVFFHTGTTATASLLLSCTPRIIYSPVASLVPAHPTQHWKQLLCNSSSKQTVINQFKGLQGLLCESIKH